MDIDLILAIGIALVVLAIPSMGSVLLEGRSPRFAARVLPIGGTLPLVGLNSKPSG